MTNPGFNDPVIDLSGFITINLNDNGLKVGLIPDNGGIALCLTMATDLGRFVVGLGRDDIKCIYNTVHSLIGLTPDQYKATYENLVSIAKQNGINVDGGDTE